jgi:hypothetical protein
MKQLRNVLVIIFFSSFNLTTCSTSGEPESQPVYDNGLPAVYSNGTEVVETVIHHGWWISCDATGYNLYQGECIDIATSPVDWACGGFSVSWEGAIYIPEIGTYRFSSNYPVNGTIYIAVNDSIVADFDTDGGGYGKTLYFPAKGWYPLDLAFAANGGSNKMHLGWIKPGGEWEIIPAENLGHR